MAVLVTLLLCWFVTVYLELARASSSYSHRKVSFEYNPGRSTQRADPSLNVLHVRAVGPNDTIHYLWSTLGAPTVLLVYTSSSNSSLHINWTSLEQRDPSRAVRIEPAEAVVHSSAVVFSRVLEYDDVDNVANISQVPAGSFYPAYQLEELTWDNVNATLNRSQLTAQLRGRNATSQLFSNGSFTFRISAFEGSSRDLVLPCLLHTANSSKLEFLIDGVAPRGNRSRFTLELFVLEDAGVRRELRTVRSIDDEYTPSIFQMDQLVAVTENRSTIASFLQWKPVAYVSREPSRASSVRARQDGLKPGRNHSLPSFSIAYAFFGAQVPAVSAVNISFGGPGGEFYDVRRHISWSALIGHGEPPQERSLVLVMVIMAVGLALPLLLLGLGAVTVCIVHQRRSRSLYQPVN
ncbi:glycosylated lysosomal membrane protein [Stegostoma tigrinum]|uniref:glycosylated lysosomal membrane protein n=1 Tax=Stegostoma tigrinum TaxID=3053191 RepID=UPI00202B7C47|nr:glycosylated lysosomal membrane protein [Stegostoma tigrinum]